MSTFGKVVSISGRAWARSANGETRELALGDYLSAGDTLITALGARLDVDLGNGQLLSLAGQQELVLDPAVLTPPTTDEAAVAY